MVFNYVIGKSLHPYWGDSIHPTEQLSNLMTERLFGSFESKNNFGIKLRKDNIDEYI